MAEYIEFKEKTSKDFGLTCEKRKFGDPVKKKVEVSIPFGTTIDFNKITGVTTYEDRPLEYYFWKKCADPREVVNTITKVTNWLMVGGGKDNLIDSVFEDGYYWYAECIGVDSSESTAKVAKFTVKFRAYPYRRKEVDGELKYKF